MSQPVDNWFIDLGGIEAWQVQSGWVGVMAACVHGVGREARIRLAWAQLVRAHEVKGKR